MSEPTIQSELARIQRDLRAPKDLINSFGNYNYRSCESILEALKPLLNGCVLLLSDDVVAIADRVYVRATASISLGEEMITTSAMAREPESKKGMDAAQLTGATSSYARKYALNGLFAIDDSRDSDNIVREKAPTDGPPPEPITPEAINDIGILFDALDALDNLETPDIERRSKGCAWASGNRAYNATDLTVDQGAKLIAFLESKIERAAK